MIDFVLFKTRIKSNFLLVLLIVFTIIVRAKWVPKETSLQSVLLITSKLQNNHAPVYCQRNERPPLVSVNRISVKTSIINPSNLARGNHLEKIIA